MKLKAKIMLASGLPVLAASLIVIVLLLTLFYGVQVENRQIYLADLAATIAGAIEAENKQATEVAQVMAAAQSAGLFGQRKASSDFAYSVLVRYPNFTGAYFGYEPNADGQDGRDRPDDLDAASMDAQGRFLPYWFRDQQAGGRPALTPLVDMESSYYYRGIKNRAQGRPEAEGVSLAGGISLYAEQLSGSSQMSAAYIVTEPYLYEGKFLVEYTAPIQLDGTFVGIAGVDRALNDIDTFLSSRRTYDSEQYLLLSSRGRIISVGEESALRTQRIEDTPLFDVAMRVWQREAEANVWEWVDPATDEIRYMVAKAIPTGNWTLVVSVSRDELLQEFWGVFLEVLLVTLLGSLLGLWVAVRLIARSVARVEIAAATAEVIAQGDLTQRLSVQSDDETGVLVRAIEDMTRSLSALIDNVRRTGERLNDVAGNLSDASEGQRLNSNDMVEASGQVAASIERIRSTSGELDATMQSITDATGETNRVAGQGREDLQRMQQTMMAFAQAAATISGKLEIISERANSIGSVVTTINRVADQTNLLSLNAAIEAEKAGEHGQGFGVVAREIRRLADQTAQATFDIEEIVEDMQNSVVSGVMEMDRFAEQIRLGVTETHAINENLGLIIQRVEALNPRLTQASTHVNEQTDGANQISEAMTRLQSVADASSASARVLDEAVARLGAEVDALQANIDLFKTSA